MALIGAILGLGAGFLAGQFLLMLAFSGGRHRYVREHPEVRPWFGLANLVMALAGAYVGFRLLQ